MDVPGRFFMFYQLVLSIAAQRWCQTDVIDITSLGRNGLSGKGTREGGV